MEKGKDIWKKGLVQPNTDFTANIMQQLEQEEKALAKVLKKHGSAVPSPTFTTQLMAELEGKRPKAPYTPVISKKAWIAIAAVFAGVFLVAFFAPNNSGEQAVYATYIEGSTDRVRAFIHQLPNMYYVAAGVLVFSIALLAEQRLSKGK